MSKRDGYGDNVCLIIRSSRQRSDLKAAKNLCIHYAITRTPNYVPCYSINYYEDNNALCPILLIPCQKSPSSCHYRI